VNSLLQQLTDPSCLKRMNLRELSQLARELRDCIIDTVAQNGGHLASSLGVVELSIALHRIFDTPKDKLVWDVGHQAYAHKLLTGRFSRFASLRQLGGISGFPKRRESPYDAFDVGHSSTSISAALGMAAARDAKGGDEKVVAIIGDGSLTAGMALEALNQAGHLKKDLIVILNDNEMSISPNVGALSSFLNKKMTSRSFQRLRRETENLLGHVPRFGKDLLHLAHRAEESLKGFFTPGMLFEAFGFDYVGPIDGHQLEDLMETLENVSRMRGPILVHLITKKGKGYGPAELNPAKFHGVSPFERAGGEVAPAPAGPPGYTEVFGRTLTELAREDHRIVAITAAMKAGTGLSGFAAAFPDRFFDVGIAEQHAVTFAAGLACEGLRPLVAIYSSFMQRAYDNVLHDVCLQNLPVTFALDRAGLVGSDGPTHHGVFDYSFLRHIPNLRFAVPRDEAMLRRIMATAQHSEGPFAYRYPRGRGTGADTAEPPRPLPIGKGEKLREGADGLILALGVSVQEALWAAELLARQGIEMAVVDPVFLKPLDEELLIAEARRTGFVVTVEENQLEGGFGSAVLELCERARFFPGFLRIGLPDAFVEQGTQAELRALCGIDADGIARRILEAFRA